MSDTKNERGRTPQQELEILRMSLIRVAQALDVHAAIPGSHIMLQDRDDYGHEQEVEACRQDAGWNGFAACCVQMANDLREDAAESWTRAKRYFCLMQAYERGEEELGELAEALERATGKLAELRGVVDTSKEQTAALLDTPEGQGLKKLLEE
jgi:hypothetical protein